MTQIPSTSHGSPDHDPPAPSHADVGHDDYALTRVPEAARYSWWSVAVQRFGQMSALSQFLLGAALGFGMDFWNAILAITLGSVILEVVAIATGLIGQREGLSTSMLTRWTGFGRHGSSLIALVIALSLTGWFGVQSAVAATALTKFVPSVPVWAWSLIVGAGVTAIVVYGFKSMAWTAYLTVPAFLLLAGWSIVSELSKHPLGALTTSEPAGPVLSLATGTTLVAGGFIVGMVITPDMTRFNRRPSDVVKQTVIGVTIGEYLVAVTGVLLAHALRTSDIIEIVTSTSGFIGAIIVVAGTIKMNDWNLYSASLGVVNFIETVFNRSTNRATVSIAVGALGSLLAAAGILDHFADFLVLLGVAIPPVAGIMVAEYYVVRRWRAELSASSPGLPSSEPTWVPATLVVWLLASLGGKFLPWGIGSLNALVLSVLLYVLAGKLGLVRGTGVHHRSS
ncbi:cytosine permease [Saccharopolyspora sp. ASAGF58]|uniref:purine-cytosine permease family protein n=1 Tax=Saccharopolyspora sp. ASAGF58 TaxID=2719023 RepID=UPI0014400C44|nr:cytosine permease [Saccharopolyspora sp. ASAGF58]QIZ38601.1 cytosine permease [Saccharopolyspora sp. ASAGF58]